MIESKTIIDALPPKKRDTQKWIEKLLSQYGENKLEKCVNIGEKKVNYKDNESARK